MELHKNLDENFASNTSIIEFKRKAEALKGMIDEDFIGQFEEYCERIENILRETPKEVTEDSRVCEVIDLETAKMVRKSKLSSVRCEANKNIAIYESAYESTNDEDFKDRA